MEAGGRASAGRAARRLNASNVIQITEARPRKMDGYKLVTTVENASPAGVSGVAVEVRITGKGHLELGGQREPSAVRFGGRAIAGGSSLRLEFPHVARLPEASYELDSDDPGYQVRLYWRDASGKRWRRIGDGTATPCRARDFRERSNR